MPEATVILQVYNDAYRARALIPEIQKAGDFLIVVVDDSDQSNDWSDFLGEIRLLRDAHIEGYGHLRLGYLMGRELGYRVALKDKPVVIMDNDIVLPPNWWKEFKEILAKDPKVGVIGPYFTGKWTHAIQHIGNTFPPDNPEQFKQLGDFGIGKKLQGFTMVDIEPEKLNWGDFLTDIVLCWRKECLDQVRKMQNIYKTSTWLANAEYGGSSGLFHYPLGTFTAKRNGWKIGIAQRVVVSHG